MKRKAIGLLHGGALGDFVLSWHLLKTLQRARGGDPLRVWARRPAAGTDPAVWGLEAMHDMESCGLHTLFAEDGVAPSALAADLERCGLIINFMSDRASLLTHNLGRIIGGAVVCVDPRPLSSCPGHITEQWRSQLRDQEIDAPSVGPAALSPPASTVHDARRQLEALTHPEADRIVLLHPGSGGRAKCWQPGNFVHLAAALRDQGAAAVFVTGPVERETLGRAQQAALNDWPIITDPTLAELIGLCAAADLCVGNDSGFSQLAAAAPNTRVLVVFGPTDPTVWRPLGRRVQTLGGLEHWPGFPEVLSLVRAMLQG